VGFSSQSVSVPGREHGKTQRLILRLETDPQFGAQLLDRLRFETLAGVADDFKMPARTFGKFIAKYVKPAVLKAAEERARQVERGKGRAESALVTVDQDRREKEHSLLDNLGSSLVQLMERDRLSILAAGIDRRLSRRLSLIHEAIDQKDIDNFVKLDKAEGEDIDRLADWTGVSKPAPNGLSVDARGSLLLFGATGTTASGAASAEVIPQIATEIRQEITAGETQNSTGISAGYSTANAGPSSTAAAATDPASTVPQVPHGALATKKSFAPQTPAGTPPRRVPIVDV
jgi:hypothetical protein